MFRGQASTMAAAPRPRQARGHDGQALRIALAGAVLAAGAAAIIASGTETTQQVALVVAIALLCMAPVGIRVMQGRFDPFEPIMVFAAGVFVLFVIRPIWMAAGSGFTIEGFAIDARLGLTGALAIAAAGMGATLAGYFSPLGTWLARRIPVISDEWDVRRVRTASVIAGFIAVVLFTFFIGGGLGEVADYFSGRSGGDVGRKGATIGERLTSSIFSLSVYVIVPIALLFVELWRRRREPATSMAAIAALGVALLITVPRGDRTFVLALVMPLIVTPFLLRGRRPRAITIAAAILLTALLADAFTDFRRKETRSGSFPEAVARAVTHPTDTLDQFMTSADTSMVFFLSGQTQLMPEKLDYMPAQGLMALLVVPVPGLLWNDKPIEPAQEVYRAQLPQLATRNRAGFAVSAFGSYYADGWYIGLILYAAFYGLLFRILFEYWRLNPGSRSTTLIYASLLPFIIMLLRTSPTLAYAAMYFLVLPMVLILWWATRRVASGPARSPAKATPKG